MPYEIIIGASIALIAVFLLVIRTNSAVVFFSICAGSVLASQVGGEVSLIGTSFIKDGDLSKSIASIALIILPAIFSAIILRKSVLSGKLFLNIIPSISAGALLVFLVVPLLPSSIGNQVITNEIWGEFQRFQPIILVVGVLSSLILLWFTHNHTGSKKSKHKKH